MQRKKCLLIAAFLFLLTGFLASFQPTKASLGVSASSVYPPPPIEWTGTYGGLGHSVSSVQQTSDGEYALFGDSGPNGWLVKVDSKGVMQWNKTFSQPGYEVRILAGQQTSDGGYMLAGGIPGTEWVNGSGFGDAIMIKTDGAGNVEWEKIFGGSGHQYAFSAQQTSDGGYVLAGAGSNGTALLVKTDSSGNVVWNKTYGNSTLAESIRQTSDGGYILAGAKSFPGTIWPDGWVMKTDQDGNIIWDKIFGDLGKGRLSSVKQTSDGGYIVAGETGSGQDCDFWLIRLDSNGNVQWHTFFWGEGVRYDSAKSVQQTVDDGFILVGRSGFDIWLIKTYSVGRMIWDMTFASGSPEVSDVIQTSDRGYAVACLTPGVPPDYRSDIQLIKFLSDEPLVAHFKYSPTNPTVNESIAFNASLSYDRNQDIVSYLWNFDDGNISSTINPVVFHRYNHPGIYNVSLTVADAEGLNSSYSRLVNIPAGPPVARFEYSPNSPVFQESIVFNASSSYDRNQDIVSYLWNFDDGNITSIMNPIVVHRYENPGIYNVSLRVVDAEGLNSSYFLVLCAKIPTSISFSTSVPSSTAGYSVSISGNLLDLYGNRIRNESVALYYAYSGYENWNAIASEFTDTFGNFSVEWIPPAPSYFVIKAVYAGNYTHVESSRIVTVSMLPYGETYLFSVESNSVISAMSYDDNNKTLSFMTMGMKGTFGYAKVTADKSLVSDIALLKVHVDNVEYNYTATETEQSWVIIFTYSHSVHLVKVELEYIIPEFPNLPLLLMIFAVAITVVSVYHAKKRAGKHSERTIL